MKSPLTTSSASPSRRSSRTAAVQEASGLRVALVRVHRQLRLRSVNDVTPTQASALARIEQNGPLRLGVLAQLEGTTAATMCRVIESLERRELIVRVTDPDDGRASLVELSREGGTLLAELRTRSTQALRTALAELSVVDRETVARAIPVLERLSELLNRTER